MRTADHRVVLPGRFSLARGSELTRRAGSLQRVPEGLAALVEVPPSERRELGYREVALRAGDRVRFSGTIEPVMSEASDGYRCSPEWTLRMRPEREPIVVDAVA